MAKSRITITALQEMKRQNQPIAVLTAYDFPTAKFLDEAGADVLLVGDSLGMVVLGYDSTIPVTLDDMLHHTRPVVRGAQRALVVTDLPFLTYQISAADALRNAGRLMAEGGAHAVKIEGGAEVAETVRRLVAAGIPVMGHLGFTPQSVHAIGGYRVQGRTAAAAAQLLKDAEALAQAGVFSIVLEMVPAALAAMVTARVAVPTIGIGAGPECSGQVLVIHDVLGMYTGKQPRFVKRYADLAANIKEAAGQYIAEVRAGRFPTADHSFTIDTDILDRLY